MKFVVDGDTYELDFQRSYKQIPIERQPDGVIVYQKSKYPYTTCTILRHHASSGKVSVYRSCTVGAYHKDKFTLEAGRMNALKLLSKGNSLTKHFKAQMWKTYLNRGKTASTEKNDA